MEILREQVTVDVSHVDWSDHPGWSRDFDATRLTTTPDRVDEWGGEVVAVRQRILEVDGRERVRRVQPSKSVSPSVRRVAGD